jgi:hypothetical protein
MKSFSLVIFCLFYSLVHAQNFCDSTYATCDSLSIDSIVITHHTGNGDRIHFQFSSIYNSLYAPTLIICAEDSIPFIKDSHFLFGIGPGIFGTYFEFQNFPSIGDSINGIIVLDNSNNTQDNCMISYSKKVVKDPLFIVPLKSNSNWKLYPNPTNEIINLNLLESESKVQITLTDMQGKLIDSWNFEDAKNIQLSINQPTGIYFMKVRSLSETVSFKILKH